jgi:hypothetical protein
MGKMAGHNRDFFDQPPRLVCKLLCRILTPQITTDEIEPNLTVVVTLEPDNEIEVSLRQIINTANKMLLIDAQKASLFVEGWHRDVFSFLKACILCLLSRGGNVKPGYVQNLAIFVTLLVLESR